MHRKRYKNVGCQKQTLQKTLPASTSVGMLYAMEIAANRTAVRSSRYPPPSPRNSYNQRSICLSPVCFHLPTSPSSPPSSSNSTSPSAAAAGQATAVAAVASGGPGYRPSPLSMRSFKSLFTASLTPRCSLHFRTANTAIRPESPFSYASIHRQLVLAIFRMSAIGQFSVPSA
jgi:hypothetical protein